MSTASLFERLGGSTGISSIVDDVVDLHLRNPVIAPRFRPYLEKPEKVEITKKHMCAFLEEGCGGTLKYTGRSMEEAHRGMNINEAEYMAAVDDILAALRQRKVDEQTQKEILAVAYSLKGRILHL